MNVKINKCIKVTLNKCLNKDMKEIKQIIRDMNYMSCKAANKAMRMWLFHEQDMMEMKSLDKDFNIAKYEKEKYGKSYRNVIEGEMKLLMPLANTRNIGTLHQQLVQNDWGRIKKDVLNYKGQISRYKLDTPYFIRNDNYKLRNHNGYFVDIAFFSKEGLKQYGCKVGHKFEFQIDKIDNNKKATINKIINGEYKQGSAQISISKKGKIELIISFGFEKEIENILNPNKILGVDLGIVNTATMIAYDKDLEQYDYFSWKTNVIDGSELIKFRQKYYNLKRNMQIASKYVGDGRIGHGYKTKMKPVDRVRNKVSNFTDTINHKYSKYIVDFAVKNGCGTIQMEDLSGATANTNELFLNHTVQSFNAIERDIIRVSLLIHDGVKHGLEGSKYVIATHPLVVIDYIEEQASKLDNIPRKVIDVMNCSMWSNISTNVATHMGEWNCDYKTKEPVLPTPETEMQKFTHLCDYLASRKVLEVLM